MIIRSIADLAVASKLISNSYTIVYDIETTGLNVRRDKIIGFGLCNPDTLAACYVVTKEWNGTELVDVIPMEFVLPIIQKLKSKKLVTHNGSYDTRLTHHYTEITLWPSLFADTMLMAHTLDENKFSYGLKDLATAELGADSKASQLAMKESIRANGGESKEYYKADSALMATYGLQDVIMTAKLYNKYLAELKKQNLFTFFQEEVMELYTWVTIPMECYGLPLDVPLIERSYKSICSDLESIEESIQSQIVPHLDTFFDWYIKKTCPFKLTGESKTVLAEMIAPKGWPKTKNGTFSFAKVDYAKAIKKGLLEPGSYLEQYAISLLKHVPQELQRQVSLELLRRQGTKFTFNLLSKHHLKKLFFDTLKEKPLSTTDKGSPQVDDDFLALMADKYKWASELQIFNKLTKIKGTYHERFLNESENGMFYPSYYQHRTTSGRYSGDAQQLPRKKSEEEMPNELVRKYTNEIRDFFIAGDGYKFVDADYTSLEVVVFADDAQDEALLDIIRKDLDFYSQVAIQVYKLEGYSADKKAPNFLKKLRPELRQQAKAFALGIRYGLGSFKLSKELNIPQEEAEKIVKGYLAAFPQLAARMEQLKTDAITKGFVKTKSGRIRHLGHLKDLIEQFGTCLLDSLELWKRYGDSGTYYNYAKIQGRTARNLVNNALNMPIQGQAASIVTRASIAIAKENKKRGLKTYLCISTHDELCGRAPINEVDEFAQILQNKMETTTLLSVPLQAEPIIGDRYGDVK